MSAKRSTPSAAHAVSASPRCRDRCVPEASLGECLVACLGVLARMVHRLAPAIAVSAVRSIDGPSVHADDIRRRLAYGKHVFEAIDLFVAPSASMAREFVRLGIPSDRIDVSDYGFRLSAAEPGRRVARERTTASWIRRNPRLAQRGARPHRGGTRPARSLRSGDSTAIRMCFPTTSPDCERPRQVCPMTFAGGFDRDGVEAVYGACDVLVVDLRCGSRTRLW